MKTLLKNPRSMFFALALLGVPPRTASAHYVWIELPDSIPIGKESQARLFFGEAHEFLREESGGRLDERAGLTASLSIPGGSKTKIPLTEKTNFFAGNFLPKKPGVFQITGIDSASEVNAGGAYTNGMAYKPMFYARRQLVAFEKGRVSENPPAIGEPMELDILPVTRHLDPQTGSLSARAGEEVVMQVFFQGKPLVKAKVFAYSPQGWMKEMTSDAQGLIRFKPLLRGLYIIDCVRLEKKNGMFKGKPFEAVRHRATYALRAIDG